MNPYLSSYNPAFSVCRLLGHMWHIVPSDWVPQYGEPMTARCERCDIERRDSVQRNTGEVIGRRYTYPKGYQFSKDGDGPDLPTRTDFRLAWLEQHIKLAKANRRAAIKQRGTR